MLTRCLAAILFLAASSPLLSAAIVWSAGAPGITEVTFTKPPFADPAMVNDPITPQVILGRGDDSGLYNLAVEASFGRHFSPAGTEWAFAGLFGNPATVSAADFNSLNFDNWEDSLGSRFALLDNIVDRPGVVHLIEEDIYLEITFSEWTTPAGGTSYSYTRTDGPIPEPSSSSLLALSALLVWRRQRPR